MSSIATLYHGNDVISSVESVSVPPAPLSSATSTVTAGSASVVSTGTAAASFHDVLHVVNHVHDHFMQVFATLNQNASAVGTSTAHGTADDENVEDDDCGDAFEELGNEEPVGKAARTE